MPRVIKMKNKKIYSQHGATLIEVLIAILILSFGLLALGAMLSFSVQMPKLSGYKTIATNIASDYVERIRANTEGYIAGNYSQPLSYDGSFNEITLNNCTYPNCTAAQLAGMDVAAIQRKVRAELPAGGILMKCEGGVCNLNSYGELWVVWQEPSTNAVLNATTSDNCPTEVTGTYTNPAPRCLYVRFKL